MTSGDYENNFISHDGHFYHHIIDPATGYPVMNGVHSVTVITDDPAKADAFATAIFVMGEKKGIDFANHQKDVEAIIITGKKSNTEIHCSLGIRYKKISDDQWEFERISR